MRTALPLRPLLPLAAALAAASTLLAGCGGSDSGATGSKAAVKQNTEQTEQTEQEADAAPAVPYEGLEPAEILALVEENTAKAKTVHVKATYKEPEGKVSMDLQMNRKGRMKGSMTEPSTGTMQLTAVGKKGYLQFSEKDLSELAGGNQQVVDALRDKWIAYERGSDKDLDGMFDVMEIDALVNDLVGISSSQTDIVQVKGKEFGGRETIGLKRQNAKGVVYVSADGSGELVAYTQPKARGEWSDWNKPIKVKAPGNTISWDDYMNGDF